MLPRFIFFRILSGILRLLFLVFIFTLGWLFTEKTYHRIIDLFIDFDNKLE